MILKGSQRAHETELAMHLLNDEENEHVEVHEVRGFISDDVMEAFKESRALARGTRCTQHLFSLSLNPPQAENVAIEAFQKAISDIEEKLGLTEQPRIIIFHEKQGRRHAHCVWSRIDADSMTAINLPHYKYKLVDITKRLFLEHGWKMPDGLRNRELRDPLSFSREEWQQAKRAGIDVKLLKQTVQECWNISDSQKAFAHALAEHGLYLAKGDRRGFVAIDYQGEVYSIARAIGIKNKEVKAKLGNPDDLPSVTETKDVIASRMSNKLHEFITESKTELGIAKNSLDTKRHKLAAYHRDERQKLKQHHEQRQTAEMQKRNLRFRRGIVGLWDYLSGHNAKIKSQNSLETFWSYQRDEREKQNLINQQLAERRVLQKQIRQLYMRHTKSVTRLYRDVAFYLRMNPKEQERVLSKEQPQTRLQPTLSPKL